MNSWKRHARENLGLWIGLAAMAVLSACSSPTSPRKSACACQKDPGSVSKNLTGQDSLVKSTKGTNKGVVTGQVSGEGKSVVNGLLKQAQNAGGEIRYLSTEPIPLTGATIFIFDALKPTTAAETTVTTDSKGNWSAVLKEGKYMAFAVHLDLSTFRLITASIPYVNPVKETLLTLEKAIAIEDKTGPTVASVYDATSPDANGLFLVGSLPSTNARVNIVFSEPMTRESGKGVLVGKVDTANTGGSLVLKDTLPAASVLSSWNGDSKQLSLTLGRLEAGSRYGLIMPTSLKDLAKNPLEKEYRATFKAVPDNQVADAPFAVAATFPIDKESLKPGQNPQITFSLPPQVFSAQQGITIAPKVDGYWEVAGSRLSFVHKPFTVGVTYVITIPDTLADLSGKRLGKTVQLAFAVKDYEGAAHDKTGRDKEVALLMEQLFGAYLQGDIGKLAGLLGSTFRMEIGGQLESPQQFLDRIRRENAEKAGLGAGFLGPVYQGEAKACSSKVFLWKVAAGDKSDTLWVQARTAPGILPRVFKGAAEITTGLAWSKSGGRFTLGNKEYVFGLSSAEQATLSLGTADPRLMGEILRLGTSVVLEPVKNVSRDEFTIDGGISVTDMGAKVAVKLSTVTSRSRKNWDAALACAEVPSVDTSYKIVKFLLGFDGNRWWVTRGVDEGEVEKLKFSAAVAASDFKVKELKPITLVAPVNSANGVMGADGNVPFRFKGLDLDSVGGYIMGLAEDPKFIGGRAAFGGIYFVRNQGKGAEHSFILGAKGEAVAGATAMVRDVQALQLPGWERTIFKFALAEMFNPDKGLAGVFQWKVIAVPDTSAAQFLASGFSVDRYYGESDFGPNRGAFAVKGYPNQSELSKIDQQVGTAAPAFTDKDLDGYPDHMETNYKTNPADQGSYPNFTVDTDGDGLADFLEVLVNPAGVETPAGTAEKDAFLKSLAGLGVKWTDTDKDGFPDDIEQLMGYGPADAASKPATRARVPAPAGLYAGLIRLGDQAYSLKFKVRDQEGQLWVSYSATLKDTLVDTVRAVLNEAMGEFLFPVRLPDNGPDSGRSLLLRGTYDKNRAFLSGGVNRIVSVARTRVDFGGGPFVGQYAASGRGEDVSASLGLNASGSVNPNPAGNPAVNAPAVTLAYRKPPSGLGNDARFTLKQVSGRLFRLVIQDEFGDTAAVLDSAHSYPQEDGSFDLDARQSRTDAVKLVTRRVEVHARLGRGKDSLTDIWVLDGGMTTSLDSCRQIDAGTAKCLEKIYRDVAGQFSAKVNVGDASAKPSANGVEGDFRGWLQQDKFGTGLTGNGGSSSGGSSTPGGSGTVTDPIPPQSLAKALTGGAGKFRDRLVQSGVPAGEAFYVAMGGRVMRVVFDTLSLRDAAFPFCGNVQIKAAPIPLMDGSSAQEKEAFTRDSILATAGKYTVVLIEDESQPGTPAKLAKAKDALGFVRIDVYLVEARYLDPSKFTGTKCLDGGTPPGFPIDAGLPALPDASAYYRGDLQSLSSALALSGNQITVLKAGSAATATVTINVATLRVDALTKALKAADADDPALGYVFLAPLGQPGSIKFVNGRPSAAAQ